MKSCYADRTGFGLSATDDLSGTAHRRRIGRPALLLGSSLLAYLAFPAAALAQNECGAPPPGGGTVTCTPAGNPYPNGVDYDPPAGLVADLTVVLQPGVVITNAGTPAHPNGVEIGSSTAGVDLALQAGTQTQITTTAANHDAVDLVATDGTATVAADDIDTTQSGSRGIVASGRGRTTVTVDTVQTLGENADGISAEEGNFVLGGVPAITDGVSVTANLVSTVGDNSTGLIAFSENGDAVVDVGTVTTGGDFSTAILAISAVNDVRVTSDSITTSGINSVGIEAQIFPFPDETPVGTIVIDSGNVTTTNDGATGIVATAPTTDLTVISDAVSTSGQDAAGIQAFVTGQFRGPGKYTYGEGDIVIESGTVTTIGGNADGIVAVGADDITITSASVSTSGDESAGIYAEAYFDGNIVITSGSVTTLGDTLPVDYGEAHGIWARTADGSINITSISVSTSGDGAIGILAETGADTGSRPPPPPADIKGPANAAPVATPPGIGITSGSVATLGDRAPGISAATVDGDIYIESGTASTQGDGSGGIIAETESGTITIDSGTVTTTGETILGQPGVIAAGAHGIEATTGSGAITIDSTGITTGGSNANGIVAESSSGTIDITSGTITTADGRGIEATTVDGNITVDSVSVTTIGGLFSDGIFAETESGDVVIVSGTVSVGDGVGVFVINESGDTTITSGEVTVTGSPGIAAYGDYYVGGDINVVSGSVETTGSFANGIDVESRGAVSVRSTSIVTGGDRSRGIEANSDAGGVTIDSGTIATSGLDSRGIQSNVYNEAGVVIESGTITTLGDNGDGIVVATLADNSTGDFGITSTSVSTGGDRSIGIYAYHAGSGDIVVTSGTVTTAGDTEDVAYGGSHAIELHANSGSISVASTTIGTSGAGALGILATTNTGAINITSGTVTTAGAGAVGISATTGPGSTVPELPPEDDARAAGDIVLAVAPVATPPDISITSTAVTTAGADSIGISATTEDGDIHIESGSVQTSGSAATGILAETKYGSIVVDSGAVNVTGAGSDAIVVDSGTTSTITIRGLNTSSQGFTIQADGGAATVGILAGGTVRGRVDLTDNADTVANAGTFDAIGTSAFGDGSDVFNNSGTTRSVNGAAVLGGLETFNNSGLVDMADDAPGDRLTVGDFNAGANSRLAVDVDFTAGVADVLVTGVVTGSTTVDVNAEGSQFGFNDTGILVVDAAAGTGSGAFVLPGGNIDNGYITSGLIFDAANFNFLLVNAPGQPIFETAMVAGMTFNTWYQGADAVESQLETARAPLGGSSAGNLLGNGRFGGWIQLYAGETEREATQSFTAGGTTTAFDVSYEQDYEGVQGGVDHQSGDTILGLTVGFGRSDTQFATSPSTVELDSLNLGAYAQFASGNFYANILAKVDWVDLETNPGPGLAAQFDAMSYGVRGVAGFRFDFGRFFAEPSVSLSWVTSDIDDYTSGGATISFDNATSAQGTAGLRVGGAFATSGGGVISPFAGIRVVEEFSGDNESDFTLGSVLNLTQDGPGTHGEASAGITFRSQSVEAFLRGELDFGSDVDGRTIRAGVRLRF